jgi:hypothetical protein
LADCRFNWELISSLTSQETLTPWEKLFMNILNSAVKRRAISSVVMMAFGVLGLARPAHSQTSSAAAAPQKDADTQISGDARTLPERVVRLRFVSKTVTSESGFDGDSAETNLGLSLNVSAAAFVAEYGVTDDLSLQVLAPYVFTNDLALDATKFRTTTTYSDKYREFLSGIIQLLMAQGICSSTADCEAQIGAGLKLPVDTAVTLPTGESVTIKAGIPLSMYADALIVGAARPVSGMTGLGDIEVGALYRLLKGGDLEIAAGAGLRFPTGSFSDVPSAQRPTGAGVTTLGIRVNVDYLAIPGFLLGWQNQTEVAVTNGLKSKSSLIDNSELNAADPESAAAIAGGSDGQANEQTYEARGAAEIGYLRAGMALGLISPALKALSVNAYYTYNLSATAYLNGVKQGDPGKYTGLRLSGEFNALAYQIPFGLVVEHENPIAGENLTLAPTSLTITAKTYYRF